MKATGPTNPFLQKIIKELREASKKNKVELWNTLAYELEKPTRRRRAVNILRINRNTKANETVVVPGKVLGTGDMDHKVKVAAWQFSTSAKQKVTAISIQELIKENPTGKNVRIIG